MSFKIHRSLNEHNAARLAEEAELCRVKLHSLQAVDERMLRHDFVVARLQFIRICRMDNRGSCGGRGDGRSCDGRAIRDRFPTRFLSRIALCNPGIPVEVATQFL